MNPNVALFSRTSEAVEVAGQKFVVRQVARASDLRSDSDDKDWNYRLIVKCTFTEAGEPAFSDEDIPALMSDEVSELNLLPLLKAVLRVNHLDVEERAKNSDAAPSGG